jgi:hypothetical protein
MDSPKTSWLWCSCRTANGVELVIENIWYVVAVNPTGQWMITLIGPVTVPSINSLRLLAG